ncbi:MAG: hypothetical protein ACT4TC_01175 [Myxococcaceae bacterium]
MTRKLWIAVVTSSALAFTACSGSSDNVLNADGTTNNPNESNNPPGTSGENPGEQPAQFTCNGGAGTGSKYTGFAGTELVDDRLPQQANLDRSRVKPYSALVAEYPRVLGSTPALLAGFGSTFGEPAVRWNTEPQASAVSLYTAYRVAFQGCLTYTGTAAAYAAAPSDASAATECGNFATKFWSRSASSAEITTCVKATVADTTTEPDARRRWAYGCAAVLSAAGFLSY